jgi:hypothetical protein
MDTLELSQATAQPIQMVGQGFYFDPHTLERASELGLHRYQFYGLGRGGVLGDVDRSVVDDAFTFFHPRVYEFMWDNARDKAEPVATADAYVQSAYVFADNTFGALSVELLSGYAKATQKVIAGVQQGHHKLVDGYRQYQVPESPVHAAYLGAILMRELRGCVHIDAVAQVGLTPAQAIYLQNPDDFKRHGYIDEEVPGASTDLDAKKKEAEVLTNSMMAHYFDVLDDDERQYLLDGAHAMFDALQDPVAVAR